MPKTINLTDPDLSTTIGVTMQFVRVASGAQGVEVRFDVPGEPAGTFVTTTAALTASTRTNLQTAFNDVLALFKAARGWS